MDDNHDMPPPANTRLRAVTVRVSPADYGRLELHRAAIQRTFAAAGLLRDATLSDAAQAAIHAGLDALRVPQPGEGGDFTAVVRPASPASTAVDAAAPSDNHAAGCAPRWTPPLEAASYVRVVATNTDTATDVLL